MKIGSTIAKLVLFLAMTPATLLFSQVEDFPIPLPEENYQNQEPVMEAPSLDDWYLLNAANQRRRLVKFAEDGKSGLKRGDSIIAPAIYDWIDYNGIWSGRTAWIKQNGKYGLLLENGKELIPCMYDRSVDDVEFAPDSIFKTILHGKHGVINDRNEILIPFIYDYLWDTRHGFIVELNGRRGYYNKQMKLIVPVEFKSVLPVNDESLVLFARDSTAGQFIHLEDGSVLLTGIREVHSLPDADGRNHERWSNGYQSGYKPKYVFSTVHGRQGVLDASTNVVSILPDYEMITQGYNATGSDLYVACSGGKFGLIDEDGTIRMKFTYDTLFFANHDDAGKQHFIAQRKGKFGVVDLHDQVCIPFEYLEIRSSLSMIGEEPRLYLARTGKGWYLIGEKGKLLNEGAFDHIGEFYQGLAAAFFRGKFGYINVEGKWEASDKPVAQPTGYRSLEEITTAFAAALVSPDDQDIVTFSRNMSVSPYTLDYLNRTGISYRGIPEEMERQNVTSEDMAMEYALILLRFRERYFGPGTVITSCSFEEPYMSEEGPYHVVFNESPVRIVVEGDDFVRSFKLGELLLIDGYWISFTTPRKL